MSDPFVAYHGVDGAKHQSRFNDLSGQGYRMISLSVYGDRDQPRYAAVWVKRAGPAWRAVHGHDAGQYQAAFNKATSEGFVPVLLSVSGPRDNPVFAGTFEKMSAPVWLCKFGLTEGPETSANTLASVNKWARQNNCYPRSLAIYGSGGSIAYAGVWLPNTDKVKWVAHYMGTGDTYQDWFDGYVQLPFRPAFVDSSDGHFYLAGFRDDSVGPWVARHGLTAAQYQTEFDAQVKQGRMPISVQGGGVGDIRYAAVFAETDKPKPRAWHLTKATPSSVADIDAHIKSFMQANNVRAAAFSARKNGTLKVACGYTWAEPGYPVTQPNSLFRLASISKAYACAAIQSLVTANKLDLDAAVFPLLGITKAALPHQQPSKWINDITVRHCVDLQGGWDSSVAKFDAVFSMRKIARDLSLPGRASKTDIARYMFGEPLQFEPGTDTKYSNFGYVLLGLVVEKVAGQPFIDYLQQQVLKPINLSDVFVGRTLRADKRPTEVTYDDPGLGLSAWSPWSDDKTPYCYGGEGWTTESMDTGGGLITSGPSLTAFINTNAVWGLGGRMANAARSGGMAGVASLAWSRGDGIDWCYLFNTRTFPAGGLEQLADKINAALGSAGW